MGTKHTPGPWHRNIPPASKYPVIFAGRNTHVTAVKTDGLSAAEIEANCNLIAAAPELLEALDRIQNWPRVFDGLRAEDVAFARAAIAKATGEQS